MWFIAFITAALLTFFDLDKTFYIPSKVDLKVLLYSLLFGFPIANGAIATAIYLSFKNDPRLQQFHPGVVSLCFGLGYLALIRLKLTTIQLEGKEVPFGIELFYEGAKSAVYRRINKIAKNARYEETVSLAQQETLDTLAGRARLSIKQDALQNSSEKITAQKWINDVVQDTKSTDVEKRQTLADFILSEKRSD